MKKNLKSLQGFETQTEQELHEVMGGSVASQNARATVVAAYAVMIGPWLLGKIFGK